MNRESIRAGRPRLSFRWDALLKPFGWLNASLVLATVFYLCSAANLRPESTADSAPSNPPKFQADWRWVKGAVFVPTKYVNQAQQWDEYDAAINDRELHYASVYGFNCVRVFLHYYIYLKKKEELLKNIEDFLTRADKYGIKTEFVFFDDCWHQPDRKMLQPGYQYPAPIFGVHNSRWLVSPGNEARRHYAEHKDRLKAYVQDIVNAHKTDKRIAFWETYNEPNNSPETKQLLQDSLAWIHETGTTLPVTATGRRFAGDAYSDFYSWHEYGTYSYTGSPEALNTECMNRKGQTVAGIVEHFRDKTGFIIWELGIGRDNCRFAWKENPQHPGTKEPETPFHGVIYPDGHPWSVDDVKSLLGPEGFARAPLFSVEYYRDGRFTQLAKTSVTPRIDFDLGTERGTGSPDAAAGIPQENFSVRWTGTILPPADGVYKFYIDGDGQITVSVNSERIIRKDTAGRQEVAGQLKLAGGATAQLTVEYVHSTGEASLHLAWAGPGFGRQILTPIKNQTCR